mgnify:CR=1
MDGFRSKQIYKQKYIRCTLIPDFLKCQNVKSPLNFCKSFLPAVYRFWIYHGKKQIAGLVRFVLDLESNNLSSVKGDLRLNQSFNGAGCLFKQNIRGFEGLPGKRILNI